MHFPENKNTSFWPAPYIARNVFFRVCTPFPGHAINPVHDVLFGNLTFLYISQLTFFETLSRKVTSRNGRYEILENYMAGLGGLTIFMFHFWASPLSEQGWKPCNFQLLFFEHTLWPTNVSFNGRCLTSCRWTMSSQDVGAQQNSTAHKGNKVEVKRDGRKCPSIEQKVLMTQSHAQTPGN